MQGSPILLCNHQTLLTPFFDFEETVSEITSVIESKTLDLGQLQILLLHEECTIQV